MTTKLPRVCRSGKYPSVLKRLDILIYSISLYALTVHFMPGGKHNNFLLWHEFWWTKYPVKCFLELHIAHHFDSYFWI